MTKKIKFFLVVNRNGTVKAVKNRPDLRADEVSLGMTLELPLSLFDRPQFEATLRIDESAVQRPEISAETLDATRQAIEQGTGMQVSLRFSEGEGV